MHIYIHIE